MRKCAWTALGVLLIMAALPAAASAQSARTGPTFRIGGTTSPVILPDVAHDPANNRYLVVSGNGFIQGQLLNANGARLGAFTVANGSLAGGYAQTPRVIYSADIANGAGGYFVTWHESVGPIAQVRGKFLAANGVAISGDIVIAPESAAPGTGSHWVMGAAIAYSTASREFLVTWQGGYGTTQDIRFTRLNLAGQLLQGTVAITSGVDWERDPSVAYNPALDEFYIAYAGYVDAGGYGYVNGQRIKGGTGAAVGGPARFIQSVATLIPSVEYNSTTGQYLVVWYNRSSNSAAFYGVSLAGDGSLLSGVRVISSRYVAYDALDVAYNKGSGDYLLVTHGAGLQDYEDAAVPINQDGTPYDNGFILTNTPDVRPVTAGDGNFNPRVVGNGENRYLAVTASKFAAVHGQFAVSSASGGPAPPPPPPPPASPRPVLYLDSPGANSLVQPSFAVAGWAVDLSAPSGSTGMSTVHVWAFPTSGAAAIFLGAATMGIGRPDIAAHYGRSDFGTAGWVLSGSLAPGSYEIRAFAFSTVAGGFAAAAAARVTVVSPVSAAPNPKMFIDSPAFGQAVQTSFAIGGWAVDLGAGTGSGVAVVHVWAYPSSGAAPVFVGATAPNVARPDVGAHFGDARFGASGFSLPGSLSPGSYTLVVFAFSTVEGRFNQAAAVPINVR